MYNITSFKIIEVYDYNVLFNLFVSEQYYCRFRVRKAIINLRHKLKINKKETA